MRMRRVERPGLVVDYIGIAQNLKSALGQYAGHGGEHVGIDEAEAVRVLMEKYEIVHAMFRPDTVCRQSISDSWLGNLRECLAHLV
jgi:type I restriction enzyme, R subunit